MAFRVVYSRTYAPRNESRYPFASFCKRFAAASIVRYRLRITYQKELVQKEHTFGSSAPLFNLVVAVIRPLDMPWTRCISFIYFQLGGREYSPAFIITCVVARLTFFMKPVPRSRVSHHSFIHRSHQRMMIRTRPRHDGK